MITLLTFQSTPPVWGATEQDVYRAHMDAISIHAPRAGGDDNYNQAVAATKQFQSTPPVRGATVDAFSQNSIMLFQSTPPVRGATAVHTEDFGGGPFQSTPPVRGATGGL